jgi:hypothetical protein
MSRLAALPEAQEWTCPRRFRVLNQHLIDAARLEGIRLGLEAAGKAADKGGFTSDWSRAISETVSAIRALDPETIAKKADQ